MSRKAGSGAQQAEPPEKTVPAVEPKSEAALAAAAAPVQTDAGLRTAGRILASPKARRLAREQGLDLERLAEAGHAQPFHVKDLAALKALPAKATVTAVAASRRLTADIAADGFADFAAWAADSAGLRDRGALLAGLAGASLDRLPVTVAVEQNGSSQVYGVTSSLLGQVTKAEAETAPDLRLRDLRDSRISSVQLGADACPVLSITHSGNGLGLTLECSGDQMSAEAAVNFISNFAGRMEQPLRHLL